MPYEICPNATERYLYMNVPSPIYPNSPKLQITQMPFNNQMDKWCYIHAMKYYTAIRMKNVQLYAITWVNLDVQQKMLDIKAYMLCDSIL